MKQKVGILHPGMMGICVAASVQNSGHMVYWTSEARSPQTRERAEKFSLSDTGTMAALCEKCTVIVSVCPPHAAEEVAEQVLAHSFQGLYLDANEISPQRTVRIGQAMKASGIAFVDGGIIGEPAWERGKTWLYLSGEKAEAAAACFSGGPLETCVIGESAGKASALKMCYAAYTKGTTALLCAILATAEELGVRSELETQWSRDWTDFGKQAGERVRQVTAKAWRFSGEMEEISSTFREAGLPGEFHAAAAIIYRRIAGFKDAPSIPSLEAVLEALSQRSQD
ncbi:MAG: NAD(P)-dependent oxidoreductase [Deltaproteobacteria bacterium]|nr:MAG: NAD(P)-dependent oxidoreductase [Deltaproteobacteria bacterium]